MLQSIAFITSFNTWLYGCRKRSWTRLWRQRGYIRGSTATFRAAWVSCLLEAFLDTVSVIILKMTVNITHTPTKACRQHILCNSSSYKGWRTGGGGRGRQPTNPLSAFFNWLILFACKSYLIFWVIVFYLFSYIPLTLPK